MTRLHNRAIQQDTAIRATITIAGTTVTSVYDNYNSKNNKNSSTYDNRNSRHNNKTRIATPRDPNRRIFFPRMKRHVSLVTGNWISLFSLKSKLIHTQKKK